MIIKLNAKNALTLISENGLEGEMLDFFHSKKNIEVWSIKENYENIDEKITELKIGVDFK